MYSMDILNGSQPAFPGQPFNGGKTNTVFEAVDPSTFDDDSDDDEFTAAKCTKPGKKTKGRVKIKMEFIENKLRRYTTFSKRKTGIMKKAYELATLTGTQVMLLVASETGHVYTFATRKLQPMITSESGKALIQTCLNSPDPPPAAPGQQQAVDQRMNPGGFEETELTCSIDEENEKIMFETASGKPLYSITSSGTSEAQVYMTTSTPQGVTSHQGHQTQVAVQSQPVVSSSPVVTTKHQPTQNSIAVHMPGLPQGFFLQPGTFTIQTTQTGSSTPSQQTVYRIPGTSQQIITSGQLLTANQQPKTLTNGSPAPSQFTVSLASQGNQQASPALTPSVFMYQTPQGIVYAPATGSLSDKSIFNFQQATSQDSAGQTSVHGQPIIIPVPVSLSNGSQQVLQFSTESVPVSEVSQPVTGAKKRKV